MKKFNHCKHFFDFLFNLEVNKINFTEVIVFKGETEYSSRVTEQSKRATEKNMGMVGIFETK